MLTHPLAARIYFRCAELVRDVKRLDAGSPHSPGSPYRSDIEQRVAVLEQYCLPKPDAFDLNERRNGKSLRRRWKAGGRGRPEQHRIQVRAALEEKLQHPKRSWRELAAKYAFPLWDLERQVRLLKALLKREGILLPAAKDYRNAKRSFKRSNLKFEQERANSSLFDRVTELFHEAHQQQQVRQYTNQPGPRFSQPPTGPGFSCQ